MRPLFRLTSAFAGLMALLALSAPGQAQSHGFVDGELLVGLRSTYAPLATSPASDPSVGAVLGAQRQLGVIRIRVAPGFTVQQAANRLLARPDVAYVEPNGIYHTTAMPNDASFGSQYAPQKVQATLAWGIWNPQASITLAIVDTGIDYTHPDLTNKILRSNGAVVGYNAIGTNAHSGSSTDPADDNGHGTHCAGIAAAQIDNGIGIAGIAGWNGVAGTTDTSHTQLMPVKVLDSTGSGTDASVASGITWAADHGARVISMSLGGGGSTTLQNAVNYALGKGIVVVAAAGNSSSSAKSYPGAYAGVISVAATDSTDTLASYSNYGSWVLCAAPGSNIYSTLPTYSAGGGFGTNYGTLSGTSMATPLVAGEAALILAQDPSLTYSQVSSYITSNVDPYTPYSGRTIASGAGRVNVYKALSAVGGTPTVPSAPTGFSASAGNGQVTLSWSASGGATSYHVKRSTTSGGPYTTIASPTGTSYANSGLTNGTTYYYVVSAVNSAGESANSAQVSATPTASTSQQLLGNPGFETGTASPWVASSGVIDNSTSEPAHSGSWKAWLCGYGTSHTDTLYQQVAIPSTVTSATLTFWLHIDSAETTTSSAYDKLKVQVTNSSGTVLTTLATYSNLNKASGYTQKTFDLTAYKGQTIRVKLVGTEDSTLQTSFVVDDFALTAK